MHTQRNQGFTLIELMIVVVVIAILAAIAIPSYRSHICKVERNQAKSDLMGLAQAMERFYTTNNFSYLNGAAVPTAASIFRSQSPADGAARFTLAVDAAATTKNTYKVTATRIVNNCNDTAYWLDSAGQKSTNWSTN